MVVNRYASLNCKGSPKWALKLGFLAFFCFLVALGCMQGQLQARISTPIDLNRRITLTGSTHPLANPKHEVGRVRADTEIRGVTMQFSFSDVQKAHLEGLLKEQQDKSSPEYHRWLTPEEFGERFGLSDSDIATIAQWLESKGFTIESVSPTRTSIRFAGTVAQIEDAFTTEMHRYQINGESHMANATPVSIPAALAPVILGVRNLSDFRPSPKHLRRTLGSNISTHFTSSISGSHYLAPDDVATIYDVKPLYQTGYDGTGQKIAVVGQTRISTTDINAFRAASGLSAKDPVLVLVPNSGSPADNSSIDEEESDLDLEWAGGIASNATIYFVYTGSNQNYTVFDSLQYAIENDIAPIISISYGGCEAAFTASDVVTVEAWLQQATAQGQTIVAAAGDTGAAACDYSSGPFLVRSATHGLAVDFPASSPLVTSVGGAEFDEGSGSYWNTNNNGNNGSAISYIPEQVWNESSTSIANGGGLAASGGGKSSIFPKPSWQNATGVPADGARDVPDISLAAAGFHDGYLFCTQGSCTNGFRNSQNYLTVGGGTSFGAPVFAAILALIDEKLGGAGQGNINPTLYVTASSTSNAFHDITNGNNQVPCTAGSRDCGSSGYIGFTASAGYDLASGLGTVDAFNLAVAFSGGPSPSLAATSTTVSASPPSVPVGGSVSLTATIRSSTSGTITGTITFAVGGVTIGSAAVSGGVASVVVTVSSGNGLSAGTHTVTATYSGDSNYAASAGTAQITVTQPRIVVSPSDVTLAQGATGTSNITVASIGGYAGTVKLSVSAQSGVIDSYTFNPDSLTLAVGTSGNATLTIRSTKTALLQNPATRLIRGIDLLAIAFPMALWIISSNSWGARKTKRFILKFLTVFVLIGIMGCGSGHHSPRTYQVTVTATDTSNSSLNGSGTFTLTVQ
jgi:subtilase family serine protease